MFNTALDTLRAARPIMDAPGTEAERGHGAEDNAELRDMTRRFWIGAAFSVGRRQPSRNRPAPKDILVGPERCFLGGMARFGEHWSTHA